MPSPIIILAVVAFVLALLTLFPQTEKYPLLSVAVLLLSVCFFILKG